MNKLKTLVTVSKYSWFVAIGLMLFSWLRLWTYGFSTTNYQIEDKFIYIGVLGGWLFICIFYIALVLLAGSFILKAINNLEHYVLGKNSE